jgi:hypothetical protein
MKSSVDVVLRKIPKKKKEPEQKEKEYKPKGLSADVEAIFEGM